MLGTNNFFCIISVPATRNRKNENSFSQMKVKAENAEEWMEQPFPHQRILDILENVKVTVNSETR